MLIIEKLKEYDSMSEAERSVANKIIELKIDIKKLSIRDLAKQAYTATSAVTRLCNKLGYEGYVEFKEAYIDEIKYINDHFQNVDSNVPFSSKSTMDQVIGSITSLYQETVHDTLSLVDYSCYIKGVSILMKSQNVYLLCIGSSIELGKIFADKMMRIGKIVHVSENVNEQFYQSYNASKQDCFIVISYSGTTIKTKQYVNNIKNSGAYLILITSKGNNELSQKADTVLTMTTREKLYSNISNYTSIISTMLILDYLYSCYFQKNYNQNFEHKKRVAIDYEPNRVASNKIMEEK